MTDDLEARVGAARAWLVKEKAKYELGHPYSPSRVALVEPALEALDVARAEIAGMRRTFDLRWEADMRAIKRWQAAGEDRDLIWPDRADMVVLLLEQDEALRQETASLQAELAKWNRARAIEEAEVRARAPLREALMEIRRLREGALSWSHYADAVEAVVDRALALPPREGSDGGEP